MSDVLDVSGGMRGLDQRLHVLRTGTLPVEDALAAALAELDSCEEELRTVVEQLDESAPSAPGLDVVPVAVVATDAIGTCRAANLAAARLLGLPRHVLVGKPLAAYIALESRAVFRALLRRARTLPTVTHESLTLKPRRRPPVQVWVEMGLGGDVGDVYWALVPLGDVGGMGADFPETAYLRVPAPRAAACLAEIASLAGSVTDAAAVSERVVATVAELVSGVEVSLRATAAGSAAASGEVAAAAEAAQDRAAEGPALEAAETGRPVTASGREVAEVWPHWTRLLEGPTISAVVALPLTSADVPWGALTLYGTGAEADPTQVPDWILESMATAVGGLLAGVAEHDAQALLAAQLSTALESRTVIDQAKGIIMGQRRCTADEAFAALVHASSRRNIKLRIIAQQLVDSVARTSPQH